MAWCQDFLPYLFNYISCTQSQEYRSQAIDGVESRAAQSRHTGKTQGGTPSPPPRVVRRKAGGSMAWPACRDEGMTFMQSGSFLRCNTESHGHSRPPLMLDSLPIRFSRAKRLRTCPNVPGAQ